MIFQPARIVIIDDNEAHLRALDRAITQLGSACLSFLYVDDHPHALQLAGARIIFCDLHLGGDTLTTDRKAYYANIVSMIADKIADEHGPYLLIVWSEYSDDVAGLRPYLEELPFSQRPFAVECLDKNAFIDTQSGEPRLGADLPGAIRDIVSSTPGLAAMFAWEEMVSQGAARTTATLWNLCSGLAEGIEQDRVLRCTLGKLATGGAGPAVARDRPGHSVREALAPLLMDRLSTSAVDPDLWAQAVEFNDGETSAPSPQLYTALHFEMPSQLSPTTRGVVSALPTEWRNPNLFERTFGYTPATVLQTCGYNADNLVHALAEATWFLVQINAACDDGRDTPGYLPFCLAAAVPTMRTENGKEVALKLNGKKKISVEQSRQVLIGGRKSWFFLFGRFVSGMRQDQAQRLIPEFRIRSALLDKLILEIRHNSARLGVVEP